MNPAQAQEMSFSNPRHLVASLITSISTTSSRNPETSQNPLKAFSIQDKNAFLTLYALFEKELLPALDVLDRGLVTHLKLPQPANGEEINDNCMEIYLVRSAQQHHTRHGRSENSNSYEVRLKAWNCSCPAFAFSAFPASTTANNDESTAPEATDGIATSEPWLFGGLTKSQDLPVCKHILACVLGRYCKGFEGFVESREVSREEAAGWSAGWGD